MGGLKYGAASGKNDHTDIEQCWRNAGTEKRFQVFRIAPAREARESEKYKGM